MRVHPRPMRDSWQVCYSCICVSVLWLERCARSILARLQGGKSSDY